MRVKSSAMVIVFDLNGTLLDISVLSKPLSRIFGRKLSAQGFFDQILKYSMALTLAGRYQDFSEIAAATLDMEAAGYGIKPSAKEKAAVLKGMRNLPAFPEVKTALRRLHDNQIRLAILTNSAPASLDEQLRSAGINKFFEQAISIDNVRKFKPAPETYRHAAQVLQIEAKDILMVAAHPWDLLGAAAQGCQTALLARPGHSEFFGADKPNYIATDLVNLTDQLLGIATEQPPRTPIPTDLPIVGGLAMAFGLATILVPAIAERERNVQ